MCVLLRYGGTGTLTRLCVRHLASNPKEQVPLFQVCLPRLSLWECCAIPSSGFKGERSPLAPSTTNNNKTIRIIIAIIKITAITKTIEVTTKRQQ